MTRFTLLGVLACVGGGVLLGFQSISAVMGTKGGWKSLSIADVVGREHLDWLAGGPAGFESLAGQLEAMPLYALLFGLGVLLFVLNYFFGRR